MMAGKGLQPHKIPLLYLVNFYAYSNIASYLTIFVCTRSG